MRLDLIFNFSNLSLKKGGLRTMLKKDLVETVASKAGLTKKQATLSVEAMLSAVKDALAKGESVLLTGFGKFEVRVRAARTGINPQNLQKIKLPETKVPAFKAGKALKNAVK
jgi:DNA-binding protein HU-beta